MLSDKIYNEAILLNKQLNRYPSILSQTRKNTIYSRYFKLLRKAAYLGHAEACYDYAQQFESISYRGMPNPLYNPKKCIYWYTKAANANHAEAYNNLASLFENGEGVEKNIKQAKYLYEKGAQLGSKTAKKNYKLIIKQIASGFYKL